VASDDLPTREHFRNMTDPQVLIMDIRPVHIARHNSVVNHTDAFAQTLAEWWVLGYADVYVMSRSGFSETAVTLRIDI